jgi:quercetin dioxygenase-like cupin family protein
MRRTLVVLAVGVCVGFGGLSLARHDGHESGDEHVKVLSLVDVSEQLDGKKTKATTVEVTLEPGEVEAAHRHPGSAFGYVLEGEYEWAIDDNKAKILKAGETFYEPAGCLHRISKNPSEKNKMRILAIVLHPADVKDIVIPDKKK